jgi:hypothetical protein
MWQNLTQTAQASLSALRNALSFAPPWAVSFIVLVTAVIVAFLIHVIILALALRLLRGRRPYLRSVLEATKNPTRLGLLLLAFAIALPTAPLDAETTSVLAKCLGLATICLLGWIALTAVNIATNLYLMRFRLDVADNLLARKHITQVRVLVRALDTVLRADDIRSGAPIRRQPFCFGGHRRRGVRPCRSAGAQQFDRRCPACHYTTDPA